MSHSCALYLLLQYSLEWHCNNLFIEIPFIWASDVAFATCSPVPWTPSLEWPDKDMADRYCPSIFIAPWSINVTFVLLILVQSTAAASFGLRLIAVSADILVCFPCFGVSLPRWHPTTSSLGLQDLLDILVELSSKPLRVSNITNRPYTCCHFLLR